MGYKHGTPAIRLLRFLMSGGGSRTALEISRHSADGQLLRRALPELKGKIAEEHGHSARSGRRIRRIVLTIDGWAACAALRSGWEPRRLAKPILQAWFKELQEEGDQWANSFDRENAVLREKLVGFERLKRDGMIYPSPLLRKVRKDAKNPQAMLERDLRREAREAKKKAPGVPKSPSPAPRSIAGAGSQHIPGTAPRHDPFPWLTEQNRVLATIHEPVRNAPKPTDAADDARILALFKNDPYGGELLPNGKIRYDNRDWTLQAWEKERFKQAG